MPKAMPRSGSRRAVGRGGRRARLRQPRGAGQLVAVVFAHPGVAAQFLDQHRGADAGRLVGGPGHHVLADRSEEHTSEIQSLMRSSYAVFCLKKKIKNKIYK